jgi:hypothetical protein
LTKSAYASSIHHCGGQQQGPDIGWQRMNTTMAPVVQLQQGSLEELRQQHDLPYEVSVGRKRNGIKRGLFDSNRNRNGNGNNNNNNKNSDNNPNTNTRAKHRGFDFLNFGRSSSTAASILQTTTPPPPPPPPSTVPTTIVVTTTASSPSLPDASSVSNFEAKKAYINEY